MTWRGNGGLKNVKSRHCKVISYSSVFIKCTGSIHPHLTVVVILTKRTQIILAMVKVTYEGKCFLGSGL